MEEASLKKLEQEIEKHEEDEFFGRGLSLGPEFLPLVNDSKPFDLEFSSVNATF